MITYCNEVLHAYYLIKQVIAEQKYFRNHIIRDDVFNIKIVPLKRGKAQLHTKPILYHMENYMENINFPLKVTEPRMVLTIIWGVYIGVSNKAWGIIVIVSMLSSE